MAVTVTFTYPVAGITAPTALQAMNCNAVIADIIKSADGDNAASVTHNFGVSAADLAKGFPIVVLTPTLSQALTALSAWTVATKTANAVTLTALTSTGSGNAAPQLTIAILRPWSAMV